MFSAFNVSEFVTDTLMVFCTLHKVGDGLSLLLYSLKKYFGLKKVATPFKYSLWFSLEKWPTKAWRLMFDRLKSFQQNLHLISVFFEPSAVQSLNSSIDNHCHKKNARSLLILFKLFIFILC